jgi:flagellar basal-body rod modification protein FlgD
MAESNIGAISSASNQGGLVAAANKSGPNTKLGKDEFLRLLTTQLSHQNPLSPIDGAEFAAQLAQFSTLEGIENLNKTFQDFLQLQQSTQTTDLLGRNVVYENLKTAELREGRVEAVGLEGGQVQMMIGGIPVGIGQLRGFTAAAAN